MLNETEIRARLTDRLAALKARVGQIEDELGRPLDDDFAEQAIDREGDEALDGLEHAALAEIERTNEAISRLDTGRYGICVRCGAVIAAERLNALPVAAECIDCARAWRVTDA